MEVFLNVIQTIAILVTAIVAVKGINSWRSEIRGKKKYEIAEEVLALFYEVRDNIKHIRSPFGFSGEGTSRVSDPKEDKKTKEILDRAFVVYERYNKHQESFNKLFALRYRFMAHFGSDKREYFDEIQRILNKIFGASQILARLWKEDPSFSKSELENKYQETLEDHESIFWYQGYQDKIEAKLDEIISSVEDICRKIIT